VQDAAGEGIGPETTAALDPAGFGDEFDPATLSDGSGGVPVLVVTRGPGAGSRYVLDQEETRIGRHPDTDIMLDDVTVSRRHAILTSVEDKVVLTDQGSLNGTYVAGERVDSTILAAGDEIQIGRFRLVFLTGDDAETDRTDGV
jgi:pSer/pThr/pTyr-binding forkhead associated (FHA) protein